MSEEHLIVAMLDETPVSIAEVGSGLACGCSCAVCHERLIARKGAVRRHHFAHCSGHSCTSNPLETAIHSMAKRMVAQPGFWLNLPPYPYRLPPSARFWDHLGDQRVILVEGVRAGSVPVESGQVEEKVGLTRADAVVVVGRAPNQKRLVIEIAVAHPCTKGKRARIRRAGIPAIEIHLARFAADVRESRFEGSLAAALRNELTCADNIEWLYHPNEDEVRLKLARWIRRQRVDRPRRFRTKPARGAPGEPDQPIQASVQHSTRLDSASFDPKVAPPRRPSRPLPCDEWSTKFLEEHGRVPNFQEYLKFVKRLGR